MFLTNYNLLGEDLVCETYCTKSSFTKEKDSYIFIKKNFEDKGYRYVRVDTVNQIGFPDILLLKREIYLLIEAKRLKKKGLSIIEDDLEWQFGQLAFAVRSFTSGVNYAISVCKDNKIAFIGKEKEICRIRDILT
jgi:hypothetical protein